MQKSWEGAYFVVLIELSIFEERQVNIICYNYVHRRGVILNKFNTCQFFWSYIYKYSNVQIYQYKLQSLFKARSVLTAIGIYFLSPGFLFIHFYLKIDFIVEYIMIKHFHWMILSFENSIIFGW